VRGLRVASRTSSFQFKDRPTDVRDIGRLLNVGAVLEGSVRRADDRVRITAQLVGTGDGYHLWSESFDRRLEDVFATQAEIAQKLVQALRVSLSREERELIVRRAPAAPRPTTSTCEASTCCASMATAPCSRPSACSAGRSRTTPGSPRPTPGLPTRSRSRASGGST